MRTLLTGALHRSDNFLMNGFLLFGDDVAKLKCMTC